MLIFRMGQWLRCCLICLYRLPIHWLCITATKWWPNYHTYKTKTHWCSINAHCTVFSILNLLPLMNVFIIISTYWLPCWLIETRPFGKSKINNILAQVALILFKLLYFAKWVLLPVIVLFVNQYSHATAHHSHRIISLHDIVGKAT